MQLLQLSTLLKLSQYQSSHIQAIVLYQMFVTKGKINTSRSFSHVASWGISSKTSIYGSHHPFTYGQTPCPFFFTAPFTSKKFQLPSPISINFEKVKRSLWRRRGEFKLRSLCIFSYLQYSRILDTKWSWPYFAIQPSNLVLIGRPIVNFALLSTFWDVQYL